MIVMMVVGYERALVHFSHLQAGRRTSIGMASIERLIVAVVNLKVAIAASGDNLFVCDHAATCDPHAHQDDNAKQGDDDAHNFLPVEQVVTAICRLPAAKLFGAEIPCCLGRTDALEAAFQVDACPPIAAWVLVQTLVDVMCAVGSGEATTLAEGASSSFLTHSPVLTGVGVAVGSILATLTTQL